MSKSTFSRHIARFTKAQKACKKNIERCSTACQTIGQGLLAFGLELVRPNDKMIDSAAKLLEAYAGVYGSVATFVEDLVPALPGMTAAIKAAKDDKGYYTPADFIAMGEAFNGNGHSEASSDDMN